MLSFLSTSLSIHFAQTSNPTHALPSFKPSQKNLYFNIFYITLSRHQNFYIRCKVSTPANTDNKGGFTKKLVCHESYCITYREERLCKNTVKLKSSIEAKGLKMNTGKTNKKCLASDIP